MKQSRLAQRKLGIKPLKKKKKSHTKFILILLSILSLLVITVYFILNSSSNWDGKTKFAVVSEISEGDVLVQILDPLNSLITSITIPASSEVEAANQLGTWKLGSITKLGEDKKIGNDFLKNTIIKSFNFPVESSANLSLIDKIRIKLFSLTINTGSQININLKDTNYLKRVKLVDGTLGWKIAESMPVNIESYFNQNFTKDINVSIVNSTGVSREGGMVGKVIEVLGLNVTSIQNVEKQNFDCKVTSINEEIARKIAKIFNCTIHLSIPPNNFDVEVDMGTKFAARF